MILEKFQRLVPTKLWSRWMMGIEVWRMGRCRIDDVQLFRDTENHNYHNSKENEQLLKSQISSHDKEIRV